MSSIRVDVYTRRLSFSYTLYMAHIYVYLYKTVTRTPKCTYMYVCEHDSQIHTDIHLSLFIYISICKEDEKSNTIRTVSVTLKTRGGIRGGGCSTSRSSTPPWSPITVVFRFPRLSTVRDRVIRRDFLRSFKVFYVTDLPSETSFCLLGSI